MGGLTIRALALVLLGVTPALADRVADPVAPAKDPTVGAPAAAAPPKNTPAPPEPGFTHKGQLEVSLRLALGLRAIIPYHDTVYCGSTDASTSTGNSPVCTSRAPFSMDFELGYGLARRIDVFTELRVGIEADFPAVAGLQAGPRMLHVSPGARFFFSDAKSSKLFTTAQVVFDFSGYKDAGGNGRGADFGIRNLNGLWFDIEQAYGFYAFLGETATFSNWLRFELEGGIGVQGRYR